MYENSQTCKEVYISCNTFCLILIFYGVLAGSRVMLHFRVMEQLRPDWAAPIPVSGSLFDHE